jgi:hypothetical protein
MPSGHESVPKQEYAAWAKRPQGEGSCALKSFGMKVVGSLLFLLLERYAEDVAVQFVTFGRLADDWTETCDEHNFYLFWQLARCVLFLTCGSLGSSHSSWSDFLLAPKRSATPTSIKGTNTDHD